MPLTLRNEAGERCASIGFRQVDGRPRLDDLWFLWSRCNLRCAHCYVASSPENDTLEGMSLEEIRPFLEEAKGYGVGNVYFTGGEPFVHPQIIPILQASLCCAPVTVLTNATRPLERRWDDLERIRGEHPDRLTFRVSLDHYVPEKHDAIRGMGSFERTVRNANRLVARGFRVIITSTPIVYEGNPITRDEAVEAYRNLFDGKEVEVKIFPSILSMGAEVERRGGAPRPPFLSERVFRKASPASFVCHTGRCVQKIGGRLRVYPCPIIYDDPEFDLGSTLAESFERFHLAHPACFSFCFRGASCTNDTNLL